MKYKAIRLILGDQLNRQHSWFSKVDKSFLYVMMEIKPESEYVTHHIQKIVGIFQAMRFFNQELLNAGHQTHYFKISDVNNKHSFLKNLKGLIKNSGAEKLEYQEPDEYRLDQLFKKEFSTLGVEVEQSSTEHFLTNRLELQKMFEGKKQFLMENFYRKMRKKHQVLMDDDKPVTGKWNYDHDNRKKLPKGHVPPKPFLLKNDVSQILREIRESGLNFIGTIDATKFIWPKDREEALQGLEYFIQELLNNFGRYQDALSNEYWSLYHSRISFAMNIKLIQPKEVVDLVEATWREVSDVESIAQVEGFIRQVLGWREYMRGIYWAKMPEYASLNYFGAKQKLPSWFWNGKTKMNCLSKAIGQSLEYSYAHHIQRLMITGNFALLAGIDPDEVDLWYLGIYIDAFEWVEITNTRGMSQFADGGIVGSKPYVSSAAYIHKMGNHCKTCHYNYKEKIGESACPFNSLYWNFIDEHRGLLERNPRMTMMYRIWDKYDDDMKTALLKRAAIVMENIEEL